MTPGQKEAFDSLMGAIHQWAMKIAEIPDAAERAVVLDLARNSILEAATEQGINSPELVELMSNGIELVVREILASGRPSGGHA